MKTRKTQQKAESRKQKGTPAASTGEKPGTIKVWSLACDGPNGTFGGAYTTEAQAYRALLEQIGYDDDDDASNALLEACNFDALEDLLQECNDVLTTWTIEENTVALPQPFAAAPELLAALEKCLPVLDDPVRWWEFANARAAIAKAKAA